MRSILVVLCLATSVGCGARTVNVEASASGASPYTDESVQVGALLDAWHAAAARADEAAYFSMFAAEAVFLGTDATERWSVEAFRAYAHPHFAKGKAWKFRSTRRAIRFSERADIAWFDEELETEKLGPARGSGVVVREHGAYKIAQYNLSIPIPNERFEAVRKAMAP